MNASSLQLRSPSSMSEQRLMEWPFRKTYTTLTDSSQLVANSMMSSGFWEDCESLSRSESEQSNRSSCQSFDRITISGYDSMSSRSDLVERKPEHFVCKNVSEGHNVRTDTKAFCSQLWSLVADWSDDELTSKPVRLCSSEDSSDSEDDTEWLDNFGEPKTRFEAALRRARLADRQRKLLGSTKLSSLTGRAMPDWGSPIRLATSLHPEKKHSPQNVRHSKFDSNESETNAESNPVDGPESPEIIYRKDICTGIEKWLNSRPRKLYEPTMIETQPLQLCFISFSEQDLWNPVFSSSDGIDTADVKMAVSDPVIGEQIHNFVNRDSTVHYPIESQWQEDDSQSTEKSNDSVELHSPSSSAGIKNSLLRDDDETEELWHRISELDQVCRLYLEQLLQNSTNEKAELVLTKRLEAHQRLHVAAESAMTQLPEVAKMQAEVEQYIWSIPSMPVATLLKMYPKPRTPISISTLNNFSLYQLQLLVNDLHSSIHNLNGDLLRELTERDELHIELGRKCVEVGRMTSHFKDLCARRPVIRFRRQLSSPATTSPKDVPVPGNQVIVHVANTSVGNIQTDNGSDNSLLSKSRFIRNLFSRKSTKF